MLNEGRWLSILLLLILQSGHFSFVFVWIFIDAKLNSHIKSVHSLLLFFSGLCFPLCNDRVQNRVWLAALTQVAQQSPKQLLFAIWPTNQSFLLVWLCTNAFLPIGIATAKPNKLPQKIKGHQESFWGSEEGNCYVWENNRYNFIMGWPGVTFPSIWHSGTLFFSFGSLFFFLKVEFGRWW